MADYPLIADHGLIGDLQTSALVSTDGTMDWFCSPRFDSPSIFASLLDHEKGGSFSIRPQTEDYVAKQLYMPGTAILITRFLTPDGVGEVHDFMPVLDGEATDNHRIVRMVSVVRGEMTFVIDCTPAFDYGRAEHKVDLTRHGVAFHGADGTEVALHVTPRIDPAVAPPTVEQTDGGVRAVIAATEGHSGGFILETAPTGPPRALDRQESIDLFHQTRDYWRSWIGRSTYSGRWREEVERSAITLKLMTYAPSGALVAAPTTGLPEQTGGERNWDYRFTWVRDASFSVHALLGLGYTEEAEAFLRWLAMRMADGLSGPPRPDGSPLQIMYRIDGSPDIVEEELDHLEGWCRSAPVRIGNGAADQLQLDIYGEAMDSVALGDRQGLTIGYDGWRGICHMLDWLCDSWDRPDDGIWETRGGRQDFTYGRLMSWVAFDRGVRLAVENGRPADLPRWTAARDAIYRQVMERGWSDERASFVQHYDTEVLDAALLYMPLVGFVSANEPRWESTMHAMEGELVSDSLVYRYDPEASPDGLRGSEGTFSICSFWYVDALTRAGRLDDAQLAFEKMLTYGNHLGLYSEEIGLTGEQLGNFPQAFSHLALISAAMNLDSALDRPNGRPSNQVVDLRGNRQEARV
jgi:GH15 family glucan-1,4-alpha-glucosidase